MINEVFDVTNRTLTWRRCKIHLCHTARYIDHAKTTVEEVKSRRQATHLMTLRGGNQLAFCPKADVPTRVAKTIDLTDYSSMYLYTENFGIASEAYSKAFYKTLRKVMESDKLIWVKLTTIPHGKETL